MPSPKKLNERTAKMTKRPGSRSQGRLRTTLTCCASWSNTPQLAMGGWIPSPRKLKAVSARIIPGTERVAMTMMWLSVLGIKWRKMT